MLIQQEQSVAIELTCRRLLQRYLLAIDRKDWDLLESVFSADATFARNAGKPLHGIRDIKDFFVQLEAARNAKGELHRTQHHLTTVSVRVTDSAHADSISYVLVTRDVLTEHAADWVAPARRPELLLEYRDELAVRGGEWLLCRHEVTQLFRSVDAAAPR
jgi:ketosteroid isomerase-like protein